MSARDRNASMANKVAASLGRRIQAELDSSCREEAMTCTLDCDGEIVGASFHDGALHILVRRGRGTYELTLKTTGWQRKE